MASNMPLRVCYFGTYREEYSRNQIMIEGLRLSGAIVIECHEKLWLGIDDRVSVAIGGWKKPRFWMRILSAYWRLIKRYIRTEEHDIVMIGYPGQMDVFFARLLAWVKHKPLVWDIFMSIHLVALERKLDEVNRLSISLLKHLEGMALKLPNLLILDTSEYLRWFVQNYDVDPTRFKLVPTGADDRVFFPLPESDIVHEDFHVLYAGTFIPNHGVGYMIDAALLLRDEAGIVFEFVGTGPELKKIQNYATEHALSNVEFIDWLEKGDLTKKMSLADVCLGAFGLTPQSVMTVQNKIYESMAMNKPVISGDSPAIRQICKHGEHIYLCERANGKAIAEAIIALRDNPELRHRIAENGYRLFKARYNLLNIGKITQQHLREVLI